MKSIVCDEISAKRGLIFPVHVKCVCLLNELNLSFMCNSLLYALARALTIGTLHG